MASGREALNKVEEIKYPVTGEYMDNSTEILTELVSPETIEFLDDDEDKELCDTEDENCEDNEIIE